MLFTGTGILSVDSLYTMRIQKYEAHTQSCTNCIQNAHTAFLCFRDVRRPMCDAS